MRGHMLANDDALHRNVQSHPSASALHIVVCTFVLVLLELQMSLAFHSCDLASCLQAWYVSCGHE